MSGPEGGRPESGGPAAHRLPRVLGPIEAFCVIVGSVIGSGIFIVPARVAHEIPAMGPILTAWVVGGIFGLCGALTLAELGAMLPEAGGPYVYLKHAYGRLPAFLFGWTEFLVIRAGSMATLAAAFALYASQVVPAPAGIRAEVWQLFLAVAAMLAVTVVNIRGTVAGGRVQVAGTAIKLGAIGLMFILPLVLGRVDVSNLKPWSPPRVDGAFLTAFLTAMVGVLWAYDGWINATALAEEIREPGRNIPRALILGILCVIAVYVGMNLMYHLVLPIDTIAAASTTKGSPRVVAAVYCQHLLGGPGLLAISLAVMCSTLISLNGNALSGPRAYFAMARDGLFPRGLCAIHPRYETPANAILAQGVWAIALSTIGTVLLLVPPPEGPSALPAWILKAWRTLHDEPLYDVLYTYVIFGGTAIYLLTVAAVFVLRVRRPDLERPYRTWGYPLTPLIFLLSGGLLLWNMLQTQPFQSLAGLGVIVLGVPVHRLFARMWGGR